MSRVRAELEVCIAADDLSSMTKDLQRARDNGAHRVELCARMEQDGLTPSLEAIATARDILAEQTLMVMVRPREGNFVYSEREHDTALAVVSLARAYGADGVVIGPLNSQGEVEFGQLQELVQYARSQHLSTTFHRAFDAVSDRQDQWRQLIEVGVDRVLTSGTPWQSKTTALQGIDTLLHLPSAPTGPELVIGGGVSIDNGDEILRTITQVHKKVSLHAFSGVMTEGSVDAHKVRALAELCEQFS